MRSAFGNKTAWIMRLTLLISLFVALPAMASDDAFDEEGPAFTSVAAANQAERAAINDARKSSELLATAIAAEQEAEQALEIAIRSGDPDAIATAKAAHQTAEQSARAVMAQTCSVPRDDISSMRDQHMSWEQVSEAIGVQPESMSFDHSRSNGQHTKFSMTAMTERNTRTGGSMMEDFRSGNSSENHSMGLRHEDQEHDWSQTDSANDGDRRRDKDDHSDGNSGGWGSGSTNETNRNDDHSSGSGGGGGGSSSNDSGRGGDRGGHGSGSGRGGSHR